MSQILDFTMEEMREWDELELQKKKEEENKFIERGQPINTRHERYRKMKAELSKDLEAPAMQKLLAFKRNSRSSYLLDSTAKGEEGQLGELKPQRLLTISGQMSDGSLKSANAIQPAGVNPSTRSGFETYNQDMDSLAIRTRAANRCLNAENSYSALNDLPRDFGILKIDGASDPSAARNSKPQLIKGMACTDSCNLQPHTRSFPASSSIDHVIRPTYQHRFSFAMADNLKGDKYTVRMSMYSPRSGNWQGLVARLDSQSEENWILQSVVDRLKLKIVKGTLKQYYAFNNEEVSSNATAKATWCKGGGNTYEHTFRIIEKAPFQVLFGTNLLDSDEIKWFSKETISDDVLVLTQKKVDKKEQEEISRAEELAREESALLAQKSQTVKKEDRAPTAAPKSKPKPKDPKKKVGEGKNDARKSK